MEINKSLAQALAILFLYSTAQPILSVSEMSKRLGYSQSKTYRFVRTLLRYGLLREHPEKPQYSLGFNALKLGLIAQQSISITTIAEPVIKELSSLTKETVHITAVNGTRSICLERIESEEPVRYSSLFRPGATLPLHCGAGGKVLMAYLPEREWDKIIEKEGLEQFTTNTITNARKLKSHLREIRKRGFAFSDAEVERDVRAVAAPIFDGSGKLVGSLSVAGPTYRIPKSKVKFLANTVIQFARRISSDLGHESPFVFREDNYRKKSDSLKS